MHTPPLCAFSGLFDLNGSEEKQWMTISSFGIKSVKEDSHARKISKS